MLHRTMERTKSEKKKIEIMTDRQDRTEDQPEKPDKVTRGGMERVPWLCYLGF